MIIDCHGHYTTAPQAHTSWRQAQQDAYAGGVAPPTYPAISDDEIRESIERSQLRLMNERGDRPDRSSPRERRPWGTTTATRPSAPAGRRSATT